MSLNPEKGDCAPLEQKVKNNWTQEETNQCDVRSQNANSSDSEEETIEVDNKNMLLKNYQDNMTDSSQLKVEESVFPLSPSTVGSKSPPPYPNYGDGYQQDSGYFDNRFSSAVNSVTSMDNIYTNSNNQIPVSFYFLHYFKLSKN